MSKVLVTKEKLDSLAESVAAKSGVPLTMTIDGMTAALDQMRMPAGDVNITDNGTVDVTDYEHAIVNVPKATKTLTVKSNVNNNDQIYTDEVGYKSVRVKSLKTIGAILDKKDVGHKRDKEELQGYYWDVIYQGIVVPVDYDFWSCDLQNYNLSDGYYAIVIRGSVEIKQIGTNTTVGRAHISNYTSGGTDDDYDHCFYFSVYNGSIQIELSSYSLGYREIIGTYDGYDIIASHSETGTFDIFMENPNGSGCPYFISGLNDQVNLTQYDDNYAGMMNVNLKLKTKDLTVAPSSQQLVFNGIETIGTLTESNVAYNTYKSTTFTLGSTQQVWVSGAVGFGSGSNIIWYEFKPFSIMGGRRNYKSIATDSGTSSWTFDFRDSSYHRVTCTSNLGNWNCKFVFYEKYDYYDTVTVEPAGSDEINKIISKTISGTFSANCSTIGTYAFYVCGSLNSVNFPSCTSIGSYAFVGCYNLSYANFPECTTISNSAFVNCSNLSYVSFPKCTFIASYAFSQCSTLATASFPKCTYIGNYAFYSCRALSQLYLNVSSVFSLGGSYAFASTPMSNSTYLGYYGSIYVPSSLYSNFRTATNWSRYSARIASYNFT